MEKHRADVSAIVERKRDLMNLEREGGRGRGEKRGKTKGRRKG